MARIMKSLLFLVLLITIIDFAVSATEISMLPEKETFYVAEGTNVTLVCVAMDLNGKPVRWDHNGELIANVAPPTNPIYSDPSDSSKYLMEGDDREGGNFTFTLLNYTDVDSGVVTCGVRGLEPVSFTLETFVAPENIFMTVDSSHGNMVPVDDDAEVSLLIDSSAIAACGVINSRPSAVIRWLWNGDDMLQDNLNITNTKESFGKLSNVTSTITLSSNSLFTIADDDDNSTETIDSLTLFEITDGDEFNESIYVGNTVVPNVDELDVVTMVRNGELACEAKIGDRIYTRSIFVDFTEANSGMQVVEKLSLLLLIYSVVLYAVLN